MGTSTKRIQMISIKKLFWAYWPILFIIGLWFIFSSPYFLKGLIPFPSKYLVTFFPPWSAAYGMPVKNNAMPDVITQIYPWKKLTIDTWRSGQIPIWNPFSFSGTPHAANYQSAIFSPLNLLFFILPFTDAWSIMVLLQPLLAGLFMYIFLRSLERSRHASLLGSIAFMFCGFMTVWMAYATLGYAVLWLPLILFAIHREMKKHSWWNLVLFTVGVGLSFFSGHFQISIYVLSVVIAAILFESWAKKYWKKGIILLLFFGFGILLSMPQLLPTMIAYLSSVRSNIFAANAIPWQYIVTLLVPDFYGNPVTRNDWFGQYAEWAGYIGIVPFILSLYIVFHKKSKTEWFFLIIAVLAFLFAFPTPLNDFLFRSKIPVLSTSAASRIIVMVSFSLSVLSSFGLDRLQIDWDKKKFKRLVIFSLSILVAIAILWLLLLVGRVLPVDKTLIGRRNLFLPTLGVIALSFCLVLGERIKKKRIRLFIVYGIVLFTAFDMLRYASKWMPFDPRAYVYPKMAVVEELQKRVGIDRVVGNFGGEFSIMYAIPSLEGYDAVYQERYGEFMHAVSTGNIGVPERSIVQLDKHGKYSEEALALLGVRFVLHRISDGRFGWTYPVWEYPNYRSIYRDNYYEIFENANSFPRAFLVSSYTVITDKQKAIDVLFSKNFNRKNSIILEKEPFIKPQEGTGSISIVRYTPTEIRFKTNTSSPKLLFLSDVFDSGWKAYIDGGSVPLYRADYDFRAIGVPEGDHEIGMKYQPDSVTWGLRISFVILIFLLLGSLKELVYAHRHI